MTTDAKLVRRAVSGRGEAYAELVRRWSQRVLAVCHALVRHRQVAEDLAQESLVRAYVSLRTLKTPEKFSSWLTGIARRVCFDWLKTQRRPLVLFSQLGDDWQADRQIEDPAPEVSVLEREEETSQLLEELDKLPEELRVVLMLYYYGDHTYADLAQMLDVSAATINMRLTKGRAVLRRRLQSMQR